MPETEINRLLSIHDPETKRKIAAVLQDARENSGDERSARFALKQNGFLTPSQALRAQFEGTEALPQEQMAPVTPRPAGGLETFSSFLRQGGSAVKDATVGIGAGVGERLGLVEEGTARGIREDFDKNRGRFLESNPTGLRATASGVSELLANLIPVTPGGPIGKTAAKGLGLTGNVSRRVAGGIAGGVEGTAVAVGTSPLVADEHKTKVGLAQAFGATVLGTVGGGRAASTLTDEGANVFQQAFYRNKKHTPPKSDINERASKFYAQWVNSLEPLEKVLKGSGLGKQGRESAQQIRVAQSLARGGVFDSTRGVDLERTGEGLVPILEDAARAANEIKIHPDELTQDLDHFMVAQHQIEASGRKNVKTTASATGKAQARLDELAGKYGIGEDGATRTLGVLAQRVRDWSIRDHLDKLKSVGVFSEKEYDSILADNRLFAPFARALDEAADKGVDFTLSGGVPIKGKRLTAGLSEKAGERIEPIFGVLAERSLRVHVFAEQQHMRNLIAEAALRNPDLDVKPVTELVSVHLDKKEAQALGKKKIFRKRPKRGDKVFPVYEDGKRQSFAGPKDMMDAFETLNPKELNLAIRTMRKFTATFRAGATLSLEFGVRNLSRDPFTLGIYTKNGAIPFVSSVRAFSEAFVPGLRTPEGQQMWKDFLASPAAHADFFSSDRWDLARELSMAQDVIRLRGATKGPLQKTRTALKRVGIETLKNPLYVLQKLGGGFEKFSRFPEFVLGRKGGKSIAEAGVDASDVTLNFPRTGSLGKKVNMWEAFFAAGVADIDKFARSMKERPGPTFAKGFAYLTVPTLWAYAHNHDNPAYTDGIAEWEKVLFIHPFQFPNGRWARIPKPPGILNLIFSYLPQKFLQYAMESGDAGAARALQAAGGQVSAADVRGPDTGRIVQQALSAIVEQTPLNYTPLTGVGEGEVTDFAINVQPNAWQPIVELAANRKPFFDQPVTSPGLESLPPELRSTEFTTSIAEGVGRTRLGQEIGGPVAIDHLIQGYLGTLGRVGANLASPGKDVDLARRNLPPWARDIPLVRSALSALTSTSPIGFSSQPVRDFYDLAEQVAESERGGKVQTSGQLEEQWLNNHPEGRYAKDVREAKQALRELSEERHWVINDQRMSGAQKDEQLLVIDSRITETAATAIELVKANLELDLERILSEP